MKELHQFEVRSEEHTSELQSRRDLVCRLLLETKKPKRPSAIRKHREGSVRPERRGAQRPEVEGRQRSKARASTPRPLMRALRSAFFFNVTATTEIYTLSLHDALPI